MSDKEGTSLRSGYFIAACVVGLFYVVAICGVGGMLAYNYRTAEVKVTKNQSYNLIFILLLGVVILMGIQAIISNALETGFSDSLVKYTDFPSVESWWTVNFLLSLFLAIYLGYITKYGAVGLAPKVLTIVSSVVALIFVVINIYLAVPPNNSQHKASRALQGIFGFPLLGLSIAGAVASF